MANTYIVFEHHSIGFRNNENAVLMWWSARYACIKLL